MKVLLQYKIQRIEELERQVKALESALDKEKIKNHEKLDNIREEYERKIDFLKEQVSLKDKRMDILLNSAAEKDAVNIKMLQQLLVGNVRKVRTHEYRKASKRFVSCAKTDRRP